MNNDVAQYLLKSGICLAVFYLFYHVVLRKESSFQYNRFYLLATALLSLLLPFLRIPLLLPDNSIEALQLISAQVEPMVVYTTTDATAAVDNKLGWQALLLIIYTLGFSFFAFRLLRQLYTIIRLISQSKNNIVQWNGIRLIKTYGKFPTFSFLNYIFWDNSQQLKIEEQEQVLQHESVHVLQRHTYDIMFMEMLQMIFWFNPLLLLYKNALVNTHEFIADAQVILTADKQGYSTLLAKQVCIKMEVAIGNFFNKSLTLKRIKMIHTTNPRTPFIKKIMALPLLASLILVFSCNTFPESDTGQANPSQSHQHALAAGFPGGEEELTKFVSQKVIYPAEAKRNETVGFVVLQATIDASGKIGNFKSRFSTAEILEAEVERILTLMPDWEPAKKDGKAIPSTYLFSFHFGLNGKEGIKKASVEPNLLEITEKASAEQPGQPVYLAKEIQVYGYN